jgi:hypothetical protein
MFILLMGEFCMKKFLFVALTLAVGACATPTAPVAKNFVPTVGRDVGDPCETPDGRSGFTISLGDKLVCQAE